MNKAVLFITLMVAFLAMFAQADQFAPLHKFKCMKQTTEQSCEAIKGCAFISNKCRTIPHPIPARNDEILGDEVNGCFKVCKVVRGVNVCYDSCSVSAQTVENFEAGVADVELEQVDELRLEESQLGKEVCWKICTPKGYCLERCTQKLYEEQEQLQGFGKKVRKYAKKAGRAARRADWEIVV